MTDKNTKNNRQVTIVGCGYIGKQLARQLSDQQISVLGIVSSDASIEQCQSQNIVCEKINLDFPVNAIDVSGQKVIYLAPPPRKGLADTRLENFLTAISNHRPERFVLISTTGVYGDCAGEWVDESAPLKPKADRAIRRADAESKTQQFCSEHDIPLVILRVPGIYGPGKVPVTRIKSGQPIVNKEDSPFTNRIHAFDLVNICQRGLDDDSITGIYNVSDGHPGTMYDYFNGVAEAMNLPKPPVISLADAQQQLSEGMLSYMAESRRIDNKKLLNDFAIELRYPDLKTGLKALASNDFAE